MFSCLLQFSHVLFLQNKLQYMDYGIIHNQVRQKPDVLKDLDITKLYAKSMRFLLSEGKIYLGKAHWLANRPIENFENNYSEVIDNQEFWNEIENYYISEKL